MSLKEFNSFKKMFLLANISIKVVLEISFLSPNNANINFNEAKRFTWKKYSITKPLSIICQTELINKEKFAKTVLNINSETFVVYIVALKVFKMNNLPFPN